MNRLRAHRYIERISQEDLGAVLGVSKGRISDVERGLVEPTFDITPTGYDPSRLQCAPMSPPLHRQKARTTTTSTHRATELVRLAGEVANDLVPITEGAPAAAITRLDQPRSFDESAEMADEVRAMFGHSPTDPLGNLTRIAERAGIIIIPIVGLEGIDGQSSWVDGRPVIGLAVDRPGDRFRFSLAHEIGHLVLHHTKSENSEHEADRFASALLIPDEEFDLALPANPSIRDFINLKAAWGMSVAALVYRAHERGHVDDRRYRSLQIQISKWRRSEPGRFDIANGTLLPKLVAHHGGPPEIRKRFGLAAKHVAEVTNWSPLRLVG